MIGRILAVALAAAVAGALAAPATAQYVQSAAPAQPDKKVTPQQQKLKDCGAQWQAMKKEGKTEGLTWAKYRKDCLKKT